MNSKIKSLFDSINLLIIISICAISISAQTAGAINGKIKWKKSYGKPQTERPCEAIGIAAYSQSGGVVGSAYRLGFAETNEYYECSYNIRELPEGIPLRVSVTAIKSYRWLVDPTISTSLYIYRREFRPLAWSGEVTLMRVKPDIPSRASGSFDMVVVASKSKEKVLASPKIRFPSLQKPVGKISRKSF